MNAPSPRHPLALRRLWGAVGWGLCSLGVGACVDATSIRVIWPLHAIGMVATLGAVLRMPVRRQRHGGAVHLHPRNHLMHAPLPPPWGKVGDWTVLRNFGRGTWCWLLAQGPPCPPPPTHLPHPHPHTDTYPEPHC